VPQPLRPLAPEFLQPLAAPLLQSLPNHAIALGPPALDPGSPLCLGALPLEPLSFESLGERLPATAERNYVGVSRTEAARRGLPAGHSLIGEAIIPRQTHAEPGLAASEAL
jgi:hypothetical protein